ncbi:GNAT family N-acetyltransferase [Candidatus Peregrinibacteria bacterium]|nr:GNAT family N-acetyltransferase [Candidatus Peregrinibacteria bacterium]
METINNTDLENYLENHPDFEELEIEHPNHQIRLVAPSVNYVPESVEWLRRPEVAQLMGADYSEYSADELQTKINQNSELERIQKIIEEKDSLYWMIECDGKIIGTPCISGIKESTKEKVGTMVIIIGDPSYWGKGIAKAVNQKVINWAFEKGNFTKLEAWILEDNTRSIKSFESLGFKQVSSEYDGTHNGKPALWRKYELDK